MKLSTSILTGVLALACAPTAFAASTADLRITGTIVPAACTPTFAGGGIVNFGKISASDLSESEPTKLSHRHVGLTIACDAPTQFALRAIDNVPSTVHTPDSWRFGLGLADGGEKIGWYYVDVETASVTLDGAAANDRLVSTDQGATWLTPRNPNGVSLGANVLGGWIKTASDTSPSMVTNASMQVRIGAEIAPTASLPTADEIALNGHATFEVVYL